MVLRIQGSIWMIGEALGMYHDTPGSNMASNFVPCLGRATLHECPEDRHFNCAGAVKTNWKDKIATELTLCLFSNATKQLLRGLLQHAASSN